MLELTFLDPSSVRRASHLAWKGMLSEERGRSISCTRSLSFSSLVSRSFSFVPRSFSRSRVNCLLSSFSETYGIKWKFILKQDTLTEVKIDISLNDSAVEPSRTSVQVVYIYVCKGKEQEELQRKIMHETKELIKEAGLRNKSVFIRPKLYSTKLSEFRASWKGQEGVKKKNHEWPRVERVLQKKQTKSHYGINRRNAMVKSWEGVTKETLKSKQKTKLLNRPWPWISSQPFIIYTNLSWFKKKKSSHPTRQAKCKQMLYTILLK